MNIKGNTKSMYLPIGLPVKENRFGYINKFILWKEAKRTASIVDVNVIIENIFCSFIAVKLKIKKIIPEDRIRKPEYNTIHEINCGIENIV